MRERHFDAGVEGLAVVFQGVDCLLEVAYAYVRHFVVADNVKVVLLGL